MKVAIYCRLSEEDKNKQSKADDSESIQNQKSMLLNYALARDWEIFNIYSDDDYTGADRRRPEFNRLIADAEERKFDIVLCKTQSRFTRELELVEKYIHGLFPLWNIRFVSVVDNADTNIKGNKKSRQINGLINEWYLEDMSENIKSVLDNKRQSGIHIGSFALYGYKKDPDKKGHLIIDGEAARTVREVYSLFLQGYGKTAIARILNDKGIPNPTEYKRLQGLHYKQPKSKNSTLWKYPAISSMLTNEIYIGNMVQGKYGSISYKTKQNKPRPRNEWFVVKNTHEPIIELETFNAVQELIASKTKPMNTGKLGIFAKKVKCASCGYYLRSTKNQNKYYLQCVNKRVSKNFCDGAFISVDRLEKTVISELKRLSELYLDKDEIEQKVKFHNSYKEQKEQTVSEISLCEKKLGEYSRSIKELYLDKARGIIKEKDFFDVSRSLTKEKERIEVLIDEKRARLVEIEQNQSSGNSPRNIIELYTDPDHLTREMTEFFIDYIKVGKRTDGTRNIPIEIHWNF